MAEATFACPRCSAPLPASQGESEIATTCPGCASQLEAFFFPAFFLAPETGRAAAGLGDASEASCFYHPQKQAAHVCDGCGRMICSLCTIDLGAEHLCPTCVSAGRRKAKLASLETSRLRYDNMALALAVGSLFMSFLALIMSPAAIYLAIRHWNSPAGLNGRAHWRMTIAILLALFTFVLWGTVFGFAFFGAAVKHHAHHAS